MWSRVSPDEFAAAIRRRRKARPAQRGQVRHAEAFGEAGLVLVLTLTLATIVEYVARAQGWS